MPRLKLLHRHHNRRTSSTDGGKSDSTSATASTPAADLSSTAGLPTSQFGSPVGSSTAAFASNTPPTTLLDNRPKGLSKHSLSEPLVTDLHHGPATSSTTSLHLAASPVTPINTHSSDHQNTPSPKGRAAPPRSHTLPLPLATIPKTNSSSSLYSSFQKEMAASATATKLNAKKFLNPMALLGRRKSAQYDDGGSHSSKKDKSKKGKDYEEPEYNPHIIYATRHPDWSSPSKRTTTDDALAKSGSKPPRLSLQTSYDTTTPIPIPKNVEKTPVFKECFDDADIPAKKTLEPERLEGIHTGLEALALGGAGKSQNFDRSLEIPKFGEKKKDPTQQDSDSLAAYEKELREGVTLQDKGGRLARRLLSNASRFSFEVSSIANSSHENLSELDKEKGDQDGASESFEVINRTENIETAENGSAVGKLNRRKLSSRRKVVRNRWSNSDFSDLEEEMANGTYDIDDDDMYFADDNILETFPEYSEDAPGVRGLDDGLTEALQQPTGPGDSESEGQPTPLPEPSNDIVGRLSTTSTPMLGNTEFDNSSRYSLLTHPHNREGDGTHTPDNGPTMPPFLNPVGAGLPDNGGDPTQFYALDGTRCDQRGQPLSLSALTYSLTQYQLQQKAAEESGFDSTYEDEPTSFQFDDYDDDDDQIIAAANAEALASDQDNYYGSEFNFYATSTGSSSTEYVAGGYFAPSQVWPGKPGLGVFRQPSLTPISERSECSYRNSMVGTLSPNLGLSPNLSFFPTSPNFHTGVTGVGGTPDQEMSLSQLLKFHNEQLQRPQSPQSVHSIPPPQPQPQSLQQQQFNSPYHHSNYAVGDLALGVANYYNYDGNEDLDDYEAEWDDDGIDGLGLEQVTSYEQEWEEDRQRTRVKLDAGALGVKLGLGIGGVVVGGGTSGSGME